MPVCLTLKLNRRLNTLMGTLNIGMDINKVVRLCVFTHTCSGGTGEGS